MELSNLWIALGVRTGALVSGLAGAARAVGTFAASSRVQLAKVQAAFVGLQKLKGLTAAGASLALLATALALSIGPAVKFEAAFANVAKTVDATEPQLDVLRRGILDMAQEMPLAATEIAGVAAAAGQLGVRQADVLEFTRTMVQLGTATNLSAEQAAVSLSKFTNILEIPTREVPLLGAALVELGNNSATTESEILTLSLRLAAAGSQFGLTGVEILAISAAMQSLGITAEVGGSTMSRVLVDILSAVQLGGPKLERFAEVVGITSDEFRRMVDENPSDALLAFVNGLKQVEADGGSVVGTLKDLGLNSIRLRQTLLGLVSGGSELADSLQLVANEATFSSALLDEYGRFAETTAGRIQVLQNRVRGLAIDLGTPALGAVVAVVDGIGDAIVSLTNTLRPAAIEIREFISNLVDGFQTLFNLFGASSGGASLLQGSLMLIANALEIVFTALNALPPVVTSLIVSFAALRAIGLGSGLATIASQIGLITVTARGASVSLAAAATSARAFATAAAPLALLAVGVAVVSRELSNAKREAEATAGALSRDLANALDRGNVDEFIEGVRIAQGELASMREAIERPAGDGIQGFLLNPILRVTEALRGGTKEAEAWAEALEGNENLALGIEDLARHFEISTTKAAEFAREAGVLDLLINGSVGSYHEAAAEIRNYIDGLALASAETSDAALATILYGDNISNLAELFGVSSQIIVEAAGRAGIAFEELADPDKFDETAAAIAPVVSQTERLAEASGIAAEIISQEENAVLGLIAAHDRLVAAMKRVDDARAAAQFAQENFNQAVAEFSTAVEAYEQGEVPIENVGLAIRNLTAAFAASGVEQEQVLALQDQLLAQFFELGRTGNETEQTLFRVAEQYAALSAMEIASIRVEGGDTLIAAEEQLKAVRQQLRDPLIAKIAADLGTTPEVFARALEMGEGWAVSIFESELDANSQSFREELAAALVGAGIWDETIATAFLDADPSGAKEGADTAAAEAQRFADGQYIANIDADPSGAISGANEAQAAINRVSGKTVRINIEQHFSQSGQRVKPGVPVARGAIFESYAKGGLRPPKREQHVAQLARAGAWRVWAEPETGGEAYIPLGMSKRGRSMNILSKVASMFGSQLVPMNNGGMLDNMAIARSLQASNRARASISSNFIVQRGAFSIDIDASGMSPEEARTLAKSTVDHAIGELAKGFGSNTRRARVAG